ncbi:MAG: hypothetical protein V1821_00125 [bacterium]
MTKKTTDKAPKAPRTPSKKNPPAKPKTKGGETEEEEGEAAPEAEEAQDEPGTETEQAAGSLEEVFSLPKSHRADVSGLIKPPARKNREGRGEIVTEEEPEKTAMSGEEVLAHFRAGIESYRAGKGQEWNSSLRKTSEQDLVCTHHPNRRAVSARVVVTFTEEGQLEVGLVGYCPNCDVRARFLKNEALTEIRAERQQSWRERQEAELFNERPGKMTDEERMDPWVLKLHLSPEYEVVNLRPVAEARKFLGELGKKVTIATEYGPKLKEALRVAIKNLEAETDEPLSVYEIPVRTSDGKIIDFGNREIWSKVHSQIMSAAGTKALRDELFPKLPLTCYRVVGRSPKETWGTAEESRIIQVFSERGRTILHACRWLDRVKGGGDPTFRDDLSFHPLGKGMALYFKLREEYPEEDPHPEEEEEPRRDRSRSRGRGGSDRREQEQERSGNRGYREEGFSHEPFKGKLRGKKRR